MTMISSTRVLATALRSHPRRAVSRVKAKVPTAQSIRYWSTSPNLPFGSSHRPLQSLNVSAQETRQIPQKCNPCGNYKGYTTASPSRTRRFVGFIGKIALVGGVVLSVVFAAELWSVLHPPRLSKWPKQLQKPLGIATILIETQTKEDLVDHLAEAWNIILNIPREDLKPDPHVKILSVAILYADALEKDNQAVKAYKILNDALNILKECAQQGDSSGNSVHAPIDPSVVTERRLLISILLKLTSLSESCQIGSEGKWLAQAIRETFALFPFCETIHKNAFIEVAADFETLSKYEPSFSGLASEVDRQYKILPDQPLESNSAERNSDTGPDISEDEIISQNDGLAVPLPRRWALMDVSSAISSTFEHTGRYAEKHGENQIALYTYNAAAAVILAMLPKADMEHSTLSFWEGLIRALRLANNRTDIVLRRLEAETHPTEWLYLLLEMTKENIAAEKFLSRTIEIINEKGGTAEWQPLIKQIFEQILEHTVDGATCLRYKAIRMQKLGLLQEAMACLQMSLLLLKQAEPLEDQKKQAGELKKVEDCMQELQKSIAGDRNSIRAQMNPSALKEWEEMERARAQPAEEAKQSEEP
ncbi:uncharacterized protein FOMMEDRAFT_170568 [Fomitiporia mediterranea MF3/22]|uniref:uncharacterized protein n=1 Tax=Fomitiporia mediterranea (strain MF3/22) TaxID=694068 RepID=UPI0004408029|nr:uncharacterized protein FOMMEDRAFT_170568 [Fomitiporia mediterranea MF3/22]EJC99249.1 hypothetical protein FOMMEDRAFT_170568 [Fomitiporia mediterranea MF3/22]